MASKEIRNQIIRYIIYLFFVLGLTALAFYLTIGNSISQIIEILENANLWFILVILVIVFGCIIFRSISVYFLTRIFEKKYFFHRSIAIDQIGSLYRMVTPAGLGGHVMEAYTYSKQGVKISNALSVLAMYSIIYQVVLILYGIITIVIKRDLINEIGFIPITFNESGPVQIPLWLLVAIGFSFNILSIGFIFLISYWNGFFRFIRGPIVTLLSKIKLVKDTNVTRENLDVAIVNFRSNLKTLYRNLLVTIICVISFFAYITISYSVPYFCGLSLGNTSTNANFWDSVLLGNLHQMVTCIIPIPGSSVVSELFFLKLFFPSTGPVFYDTEEIARASLLLWRGLMFIFPLLIACLYTIVYRPRKRICDENNENKDLKE
ncbi:MAG: flippase-like domain-containing protein [Bacilli bacterium]|nr:flippase-like domain-containing protein [Bacilli bacterium]